MDITNQEINQEQTKTNEEIDKIRIENKNLTNSNKKLKTIGIVLGSVLGVSILTASIVTPIAILNNNPVVQKTFKVEFDAGEGTAVETQNVENDKKAIQPYSQRENYWLEGWYENQDYSGEKFDFTKAIQKDIKLYAKWVQDSQPVIEYEVKFHSNYQKVGEQKEEILSTKIRQHHTTLPANMARDGYSLEGWYKERECINKFEFNATKIEKDTDIWAKWKISEFKVSFDSNGGTNVDIINASYNQKIQAPTPPTKDGYDFGGWYTDTTLQKQYDFNTPVTTSFTLYAKWTAKTFTVTFNTDGAKETLSVQKVKFNEKANNPGNITKDGNTFIGWYSDSQKTNIFSFDTPIISNTTIYAKWEVNKYTITYDTNGGSAVQPSTVEYGQTISKPITTKTGYTCNNWYTNKELTTEYDFSKTITSSITLYAGWVAEQFTVKFITNSTEQTIADQTVNYDTTIKDPGVVTKTGHKFIGWYSDQELTVPFSITTHITSNMTIYAKWEINTYTVTFNSNGGTYIEPAVGQHGSTITEPAAPTKDNSKFEYWCTDAGLTNKYVFSTQVTKSFTLYAKWSNVYAESVKIAGAENNQEYNIADGDVEIQLAGSVLPAGASQDLSWTYISSNENITFDTTSHKILATKGSVGEIAITASTISKTPISSSINVRFYDYSNMTFTKQDSEDFYTVGSNNTTATSITIPSSYNGKPVQKIDTFKGATNLKEIVIPETITELKRIEKWDGTTLLEVYGAFTGLTNLQSVTLPKSLTTIESYTFQGCSSLRKLDIGKNVTNISNTTFTGTSSLQEINVDSGNPNYTSIDGVLYNKDCSQILYIPSGKTGTLTLPNSVTTIKSNSFAESNISTVILPSATTTIEANAFRYAKNLKSINLQEGMTQISSNCFQDCTSLTGLELPTTVSTIRANAFNGCGVQYLDLTNVKTLEQYAFSNANKLQGVTFGTNITDIPRACFKNCKELFANGCFTIPETVTSIGINAFESSGIAAIVIPTNITVIPSGCFYDCTNLGKGTTTIERGNSVVFKGNITNIETSAFMLTPSLVDMDLPASLQKVGRSAFGYDLTQTSGITRIMFKGTKQQWGNIVLYYLDSTGQEKTEPFGTETRPQCFPTPLHWVECTDGKIEYH